MSEANRSNQANNSSCSDQQDAFTNPFGEIPEVESESEAETSAQSMQFDADIFDANAFDADAIDSSVPQNPSESIKGKIGSSASSAHSVTITPGVENWINSSESTDLADLISLIQELNQCNSILLDRVSQLEEALERSQTALKAEVKRSQNYTTDYNPGLSAAQDLAAAQEQAIDLYNQLEFVHQTSQRQQILIETLTGQLETSQERVAQLEREAALVQQRYNEQTQLLAQAENNCRDLQARLHRQQRYTLQFKVALEKSLDVSTPHYEPVTEMLGVASASDNSFLPRVQHIQPWTSPVEISSARFPWMKLSSEPLQNVPVGQTDAESAVPTEMPFAAADIPPVKSRRSKLAAVKLPGFPTAAAAPEAATSPNLQQAAPETADLSAIPDEKLMQKLDSMVQPLANLLAEAVLTEVTSASSPQVNPEVDPVAPSATTASANQPIAAPPLPTHADDLLSSVMADAEDALWQDLARLIDVSTEDVVKASLSGDLSAFESIDFDALQPTDVAPSAPPKDTASPPAQRFQQTDPTVASSRSTEPAAYFTKPDQSIADDSTSSRSAATPSPSVFGANPGWPAPLIYPTQPAKKRRSLAAVDLPSFLQPQPGPLPT